MKNQAGERQCNLMALKWSMLGGYMKSTEVREAASLCHKLHTNPAHSRQVEQWGALALNQYSI